MHAYIAVPVTLLLIYRSYSHNSLTPLGIFTAALTAAAHAVHPSPLPFVLLVTFFLLGTTATKIKADQKSQLTLSSTGHNSVSAAANGKLLHTQEPRSAVQVFANSACASLLCLLHTALYGASTTTSAGSGCLSTADNLSSGIAFSDKISPLSTFHPSTILLAGIIANYAATTADTLSSELGILSPYTPRFILNLKEVPRGTNGGVTGLGLMSGLGGALFIGGVSMFLLPECVKNSVENADIAGFVMMIGAWGALGSVLDSILGATLQASVVDRRSGKIVEAGNGGKVLTTTPKLDQVEHKEGDLPGRFVASGRQFLDNNEVNLLMASVMTVGGMVLASLAWEIPLQALWT